jgi:carbonic anhydrase
MANIDPLLERNKHFATTAAREGATIVGRVSPDVLTDLAYIGYLSRVVTPAGPRFEVAIIHHTDCGTHFLADTDFRRGFADLIGGDDAALAAEAVVHPEQTVRLDVELLRSSTILPTTITVSGHVYDVETGLITTVIPAAPMHSSTTDPTATSA